MEPFALPNSTPWWQTIFGAGLFAKIDMFVLFIFSVISWAIILRKLFLFRAIRRENRILLNLFQHRRSPMQFQKAVGDYRKSPLAKILGCGIQEWENLKKQSGMSNPTTTVATSQSSVNTNALLQLLPNIQESMNRTGMVELERAEKSLPFLATISSVSPFLGLLGTVWGVLAALLNVRNIPVITLQVIAPGVSDALVTTVAGLLVAIPALIFYNHFVGSLKDLASETERFISEILGDFRKDIFFTKD